MLKSSSMHPADPRQGSNHPNANECLFTWLFFSTGLVAICFYTSQVLANPSDTGEHGQEAPELTIKQEQPADPNQSRNHDLTFVEPARENNRSGAGQPDCQTDATGWQCRLATLAPVASSSWLIKLQAKAEVGTTEPEPARPGENTNVSHGGYATSYRGSIN